MRHRWNRFAIAFVLLAAFATAAQAKDESAAAPESPLDRAWEAAAQAMQHGPHDVALRDQARLKLPEGYGFIPLAQASVLMQQMGNDVDEDFIGLIVPLAEEQDWLMTVDFDPAGHISDEDARNWNADELLQNLKDGTEAGNERRVKLGIAPLEVTRWIERPAYDSTTQRLVWSAEARDKGAAADSDNTVNYNTYVLGREGYVSLDLITTTSQVEAQKPAAKALLSAVSFVEGKRYADFDASTDKVAAYGLAALIGGVAAKKLGLLAMAGVFFAKFFKLIAVAVLGGAAALRKFFTRNKA